MVKRCVQTDGLRGDGGEESRTAGQQDSFFESSREETAGLSAAAAAHCAAVAWPFSHVRRSAAFTVDATPKVSNSFILFMQFVNY